MQVSMITSAKLDFFVSGSDFAEFIAWQQAVDYDILNHQIETRGHALITQSGQSVQRITRLPGLGEVEPYYGSAGGAYCFRFRPMEDFCELEIVNRMGGFAFFYPERFPPFRMRLSNTPRLTINHKPFVPNTFTHYQRGDSTITFTMEPAGWAVWSTWAWFGRPLTMYDFFFTPTSSACLTSIQMRESGALFHVVRE